MPKQQIRSSANLSSSFYNLLLGDLRKEPHDSRLTTNIHTNYHDPKWGFSYYEQATGFPKNLKSIRRWTFILMPNVEKPHSTRNLLRHHAGSVMHPIFQTISSNFAWLTFSFDDINVSVVLCHKK